jgi:hypothetical protein
MARQRQEFKSGLPPPGTICGTPWRILPILFALQQNYDAMQQTHASHAFGAVLSSQAEAYVGANGCGRCF